MGILADFFVADSAEGLRYANRFSDSDEGEEIEELLQPHRYKGITSLELGTLWAILEGEDWDVKKHMLDFVQTGENDESWLNRFPEELTQLLMMASDDQLQGVAISWAKTEELNCEPEDLKPILLSLHKLSKESVATNRWVYLWGSL